jgi:hypothetical protein
LYYGGYRSFGVIDRGRLPAHHYQEGERLPCGDIAAILCCGSTRYLAGQFGVVAYREASDSFAVVPTTQSRRATSLLLLGDSLWYGTLSRGVRLVDLRSSREAGAFLDGTMRVTGLAEVSVGGRGTVFVATKRDGCALVDRQTMRLAKLALPLKMLGALEKGEGEIVAMRCMDGRVWLGTRAGGCLIYDPRDARWRVFAWHEGLVTNQVRSFCDDARYVWIGCYGGITRLDKTYLNTTLFGRPRSGS